MEDGLKFYRQILKDAHKVVNEKILLHLNMHITIKEAMAGISEATFP